MDAKLIPRRVGLYFFYTLAALSSMFLSFGIINFLFNFDNKGALYEVLILLLITVVFWVITFGLSILGKKDKAKRKKEFINLFHKLPLILLSTLITGVYVMILFFFFAFITTSSYNNGGMAGNANFTILMISMLIVGVSIISLVMYKVMTTDKQNISLTIYNQFSILKWASLVALPFGVWASYYFYNSEGTADWIAMGIWALIFYGFYRLFNRISEKVQTHITDANVNRILHERSKKIVNEQKDIPINTKTVSTNNSLADELQKLKNLLDTNILTEEEYKVQKERLLK